MISRKPVFSILIYAGCFVLSLFLPWWLAVPLLLLPLPFIRFNLLAIPAGLVFDVLYGHVLAGFPYHTYKYTLVMALGVGVAALLKRILRL